ncbi:MAG: hypothetical protein Q8R39_04630 [bacterium]|nr:hypothetical protein [bacterium]MDZ4285271.1 hypothetical protein [Patescibacteria group bacterium]
MFPFGMFNNGFAHLRRHSGAERAWRFPDVRRLWLWMLIAGAGLVVGLSGYGVLTFRYLDRLDLTVAEPDIPLRLARVLDEELLRSVRAEFDALETVHKRLLENPSADIVDPAR